MNDEYPTCKQTYVTLRAYHESAEPSSVSDLLGLTPTDSQRKGEFRRLGEKDHPCRLSGWFLCSRNDVQSHDSTRHLDWLLRQLAAKSSALSKLREEGWRLDIVCLWDSQNGHGGPTLPPSLLSLLAAVGIELWFDVYFTGDCDGLWRKFKEKGYLQDAVEKT